MSSLVKRMKEHLVKCQIDVEVVEDHNTCDTDDTEDGHSLSNGSNGNQ